MKVSRDIVIELTEKPSLIVFSSGEGLAISGRDFQAGEGFRIDFPFESWALELAKELFLALTEKVKPAPEQADRGVLSGFETEKEATHD